MPYDGGSVIGLINLLIEVAVPHANMQPMAYSAPAITEAKHQLGIWVKIFFFFSPAPKKGVGKRKISLDCQRTNLSYHLLSHPERVPFF